MNKTMAPHKKPREFQEVIDIVVFHDNCMDGMTSAAVAYLYANVKRFIPMNYTTQIVFEEFENKNVIVLDFSFKREVLIKLQTICKKIVIIDHHISAMKDLEGLKNCIFDMNHCGAYLTYRYFTDEPDHGYIGEEEYTEKNVPKFIKLIQDRDLWTWSLREFSEPLNYALNFIHKGEPMMEQIISYSEYIQDSSDLSLKLLVKIGKLELETNRNWCAKESQKASRKNINIENKIYSVMAIYLKDEVKLISELSEYLYNHYDIDFTMVWYKELEDYRISFRTNKENIDVSLIAKTFGGGGHKKASGASIKFDPFILLQ
jgi:oligoribonuclease NrnB/cAMP/cGMP phosphodiesterase (DHH superfamily)